MKHLHTVCATLVAALALVSIVPVAAAFDLDGRPVPPPPVSRTAQRDDRPETPVPPCPPVTLVASYGESPEPPVPPCPPVSA